jgi:hypothetical protein
MTIIEAIERYGRQMQHIGGLSGSRQAWRAGDFRREADATLAVLYSQLTPEATSQFGDVWTVSRTLEVAADDDAGEPTVHLGAPDGEAHYQTMSPAEARDLAGALLAAADTAELASQKRD